MDRLSGWVADILFFLVFITVTENLLPGRKYHSYIRLCAGMILILLVLEPMLGGLHLEDELTRYFEAASFKQEAEELSREILGMEDERLSRVIDTYEQVVEEDIDARAREMGITLLQARVTIDRDRESGGYGSVAHICMEVQKPGQEEEEDGAVQAVTPIEQVRVTLGEQQAEEGGTAPEDEVSDPELEKLRRKVGTYYGLETGEVEIQFQGK